MTAILEDTMRAAGLREWLKSKDPGFVAVKRAARVTLAACVAFYFSLYVLDDTQMATFAAFGCIALGALSEVTGEPWQRTKTYGAALLAGIVLGISGHGARGQHVGSRCWDARGWFRDRVRRRRWPAGCRCGKRSAVALHLAELSAVRARGARIAADRSRPGCRLTRDR